MAAGGVAMAKGAQLTRVVGDGFGNLVVDQHGAQGLVRRTDLFGQHKDIGIDTQCIRAKARAQTTKAGNDFVGKPSGS